MLNPDTAEEYDTSSYTTLSAVGSPVLTQHGHVFAINGTYASLADPLQDVSTIVKLPSAELFPNGIFRYRLF